MRKQEYEISLWEREQTNNLVTDKSSPIGVSWLNYEEENINNSKKDVGRLIKSGELSSSHGSGVIIPVNLAINPNFSDIWGQLENEIEEILVEPNPLSYWNATSFRREQNNYSITKQNFSLKILPKIYRGENIQWLSNVKNCHVYNNGLSSILNNLNENLKDKLKNRVLKADLDNKVYTEKEIEQIINTHSFQGFQPGDEYIFRYKAHYEKEDISKVPIIIPRIGTIDSEVKFNEKIIAENLKQNGDWMECTVIFNDFLTLEECKDISPRIFNFSEKNKYQYLPEHTGYDSDYKEVRLYLEFDNPSPKDFISTSKSDFINKDWEIIGDINNDDIKGVIIEEVQFFKKHIKENIVETISLSTPYLEPTHYDPLKPNTTGGLDLRCITQIWLHPYISYFEENKVAVIGSNTMNGFNRAFNPKLTEKINGEISFEFSLFKKYKEKGQLIDNMFLPYLHNESLIKVKWRKKWYNLVIKQIQENSEKKTITYTCNGQAVVELSKIGYSKVFSPELFNNIGTIKELTEKAIEGTGWSVGSIENIQEYIDEPLYEIKNFSDNIDIISITNQDTQESKIKHRFFVFWSNFSYSSDKEKQDKINYFQIIYNPEKDEYLEDNENFGVIDTSLGNYQIQNITKIEETEEKIIVYGIIPDKYIGRKEDQIFVISKLAGVYPLLKGRRFIRSQKTAYDPLAKRYMNVFRAKRDGKYNGISFDEGDQIYQTQITEITDSSMVIDFATNGSNFTDGYGWMYPPLKNAQENSIYESLARYPLVSSKEWMGEKDYPSLKEEDIGIVFWPNFQTPDYDETDKKPSIIEYDTITPWLYNSAFLNAAEFFPNGIKAGQKFILVLKAAKIGNDSNIAFETYKNSHGIERTAFNTFNLKSGKDNIEWNQNDSTLLIPEISYCKTDRTTVQIIKTPSSTQLVKINLLENNQIDLDSAEYEITFLEDIPRENLIENYNSLNQSSNLFLGLFLNLNSEVYEPFLINKLQIFQEVQSTNDSKKFIEPTSFQIDSIAKVNNVYYDFTTLYPTYENYSNFKELPFLWQGEDSPPQQFEEFIEPVYIENFESYRTIQIKQSNVYNILQKIAETFKCYIDFQYEINENGGLKYNEWLHTPIKRINVYKNNKRDTSICFEYGIDLKSIQRTLKSNELITKTYVQSYFSEFADNGICAIGKSSNNPNADDFILNLDYYIQANIIDAQQLAYDLYGTRSQDLGYYTKLFILNKMLDNYNSELESKKTVLKILEARIELLSATIEAYNTQISISQNNLQIQFNNLKDDESSFQEWFNKYRLYLSSDNTYQSILAQWLVASIFPNQKEEFIKQLDETTLNKETVVSEIDNLKKTIESAKKQKILLTEKFNQKYASFIQEGSWNSSDYLNSDKYYYAALDVAYTSSRPQLQYTIIPIRLAALENFNLKDVFLGDICYVIDRDYFGYMEDGRTPIKEKVFITQLVFNFDEPTKDSITTQNYRTQFDDLFQRIVANMQAVTYAKNSYDNAANGFGTNGLITNSIINDSLSSNPSAELVAAIGGNSANGLRTRSSSQYSNSKTKILNGEIYYSIDGGHTWTTTKANQILSNTVSNPVGDNTLQTALEELFPS